MRRENPAGGLPGRILAIDELEPIEMEDAFSYNSRRDQIGDASSREALSLLYEDGVLGCQRFEFETWVPMAWVDITEFSAKSDSESRAHIRYKRSR